MFIQPYLSVTMASRFMPAADQKHFWVEPTALTKKPGFYYIAGTLHSGESSYALIRNNIHIV